MKNEKGITLVELLAVLALMSLIIVLIGSVHIFGQKQFTKQTEQIDHQANVRLAMSTVMKEIRTVGNQTISVEKDVLTIGTDVYKHENKQIKKNNVPIINNINKFVIEKEDEKITITITSIADQQGKTASVSSIAYIRK